jgi:hypothetical protein
VKAAATEGIELVKRLDDVGLDDTPTSAQEFGRETVWPWGLPS